MIVENITKVDGVVVINDLEKAYMKRQTTTFVLQAFVILCGVVMVGLGISSNTMPNIAFGSVFILLGLIYVVYTINRIIREKKEIKVINKTVYDEGCLYDYKFKQESIIVSFQSGSKHQKFETKYDEVKKIWEYKTQFKIEFYDHTVLYIDKSGFKGEKAIEFFKKNIAFNKKKIKDCMDKK